MNLFARALALVLFLCVKFVLSAIPSATYQDGAIWNIIAGRSLIIHPSDVGCASGMTYCLPHSSGPPLLTGSNQANAQQNNNQCLAVSCIRNNSLLSSMTDENLSTVFVTRSINRLEIVADLNSTFDVFHIRLAFSGNPPASISIERGTDGSTAWIPWQYYAVDCLSAFGIPPNQPIITPNTVQCSSLPWIPRGPHLVDSLFWNVFQGRQAAVAEITRNHALQQFFSTSAVRITLAGHLLSPPSNAPPDTNYGMGVYGIAEIGIYGRCGEKFHRSANNTNTCDVCDCSSTGAVNETCTSRGICTCKGNFQGPKCATCQAGFYNASLGCFPCNCDLLGTTGDVCNNRTGACICRPGFRGARCGECQAGNYLLGHLCVGCECSRAGSLAELCDRNGTCLCKRFVTGPRCDTCVDGFVDLSGSNINGCTLRLMTTSAPADFPLALPVGFDHTVASRAAAIFPLSNTSVISDLSTSNGSVIILGTPDIPSTAGNSYTSYYSNNSSILPWLITIVVLLIVALLILSIHFFYYIRRRNYQRKYSPRQVPEFLSVDTRQHPDYAARKRPLPPNTRLTGYFYNPEYPTSSLTPGTQSRRATDEGLPVGRTHPPVLEEENEPEVNYDTNGPGRPRVDLTREPANTGTHRPFTQRTSPLQRRDGISTISGGIVNENFNSSDIEI